jgi:hypothetical protein
MTHCSIAPAVVLYLEARMDNKNVQTSRSHNSAPLLSAAAGKAAGSNRLTPTNGIRPGTSKTHSDESKQGDPTIIKHIHNDDLTRIFAIVYATKFVKKTSVARKFYYEMSARETVANRDVDDALSHYITAYRTDGRTVPKVALVDTLRQCISRSIQQPEITEQNEFDQLIAKLISEAEKSCINIEINTAIKVSFFAFEKPAREEKSKSASETVQTAFHHIMLIITFPRTKIYTIPSEYKESKYDPTVFWTFYEDLTNQRARR